MGTDVQNVVEKVYYRIQNLLADPKPAIYRFEIETMVDNALNRLGDRVADGPDFVLLQKTIAVSLTSGIGTFADDTIIIRSIPEKGNIKAAGNSYSLQFLPFIQDLELGGRPLDFLYYTLRGETVGGSIYVYNGDGTASTAGSVTVRANYYPTQNAGSLAALPTQLQDDLVDILMEFCQEKLNVQNTGNIPASPSTGQ